MSPRLRPRPTTGPLALVLIVLLAAACSGGQTAVAPPIATAEADLSAEPTPTVTPAPAVASPEDRSPAPATLQRVPYGEHPSQFGELWLPAVEAPPVVVLVHGGFWQDRFGLRLMDGLAQDLVQRGYAVWNIEYRRVGADGGGYPMTLDDVAAAMDVLAPVGQANGLDLDRVAFVGHSAGGHLALWAAGREAIPPGEPWSDPLLIPVLTVGQAPVVDLVAASRDGAGGGAVDAFLGGSPEDVPERYAAATPSSAVSGSLLIILGDDDAIVAREWTGGSPAFDAARLALADTDHFQVIDPAHPSWAVVVAEIDRAFGAAG